MHATRSLSTGAAILALTLALVTPVMAQDTEATAGPEVQAPAAVTGVIQATRQNQATQSEPGTPPALTTTSNYGWTLAMEADDPRLSGEYETNQNYHSYLSGIAVRSGVGRLANEGGSWTVEFHGFTPPLGNQYISYFTGEGGYEGLSAVTTSLPTTYGSWQFDGVIFPGPLPEPPAWILPPTE